MDELHMLEAEFLEEFVEFGKSFGDHVSGAVVVFGVVDLLDGEAVLFKIALLKRVPDGLIHLQKHAEAGRFLPAAVAETLADILIFLGRHGFEKSDLLDHEALRSVNAAKKSENTIGVFLLKIVIDVEKGIGDELHPELFNLMDDLELHFVAIAKFVEIGLATEQRFGVEIFFVIKRAIAVHDCVELLTVHW